MEMLGLLRLMEDQRQRRQRGAQTDRLCSKSEAQVKEEARGLGAGSIVMVNTMMWEEKRRRADWAMEISNLPPPSLTLSPTSPALEVLLRT